MKIELFDKVVLQTGESGYIVEILEGNKAYIADIDLEDGDIDTRFIDYADIIKVIQ